MPYSFEVTEDAREFRPIPDGDYPAFVQSIQEKRGDSGSSYLSVRFVLESGPYKSRSFFTNVFLSGDASWKLNNLLRACGYAKGRVEFTTEELIGKLVRIRVATETYNNEERNAVSNIFPLRDEAKAPAPAPAPTGVAATAAPARRM
jgi:hypothetical protein